MVFCCKKELIFIHIPKCGGTSVENALNMTNRLGHGYGIKNGKAMQHYSYSDYQEMLGDEAFDRYYKFAIVRNPYTRFMSEYHWCEIKDVGRRCGQDMNCFITYCEGIVERGDYHLTIYHDHIMPQYKYIYDNNDRLIVDKVFKIENYNEVEKMLNDRYKVLLKEKALVGNYDGSFRLTEKQKKRVYKMYKKDFELFGYNV